MSFDPHVIYHKVRGQSNIAVTTCFLCMVGCFSLLGNNLPGFNQNHFTVNDHVISIHKKTLRLKIKEAGQDLHKRRLEEPGNKMYDFLESYTWFFSLFILEDETQYKRALNRKKKLLENIRSGDPDSPYYLFCQAEILLQWATIHLKFNEKTRAAYDVYEAYNLLIENKNKFPHFKENNKSLSIIHALAQSLPNWVQKLSGIKGSVNQGTKEIEILVNELDKYPLFREEILAVYVYILFYTQQEKEKAYNIIQTYKLQQADNPLLIFLSATITQKTGRNDEAIKILESRRTFPGQLPFYYLDFLYGKYKLYRLDKDAIKYILKFTDNFSGRHYIKEAYQKAYWYELLFGQNEPKKEFYIQKVKTAGKALIDEDIQALSEIKGTPPHPLILRARLLYDGGYYTRSQQLLLQATKKEVVSIDPEEYNYRLARNADALQEIQSAVSYYLNTIALSNGKKYYACSASLHLGLIYEKENKPLLARQYFKKCLTLHPEGYSTSLHQKAKTALARLEK